MASRPCCPFAVIVSWTQPVNDVCLQYMIKYPAANLLAKNDSNKLLVNLTNEMTAICAKLSADLMNISEVTNRETKWPNFLADPVHAAALSLSLIHI